MWGWEILESRPPISSREGGFWVREFWLILDMGNPASLILSQEVFFVDSHRLYCTYRGPALLGIMIYASSLSDWGAGGNLQAEV